MWGVNIDHIPDDELIQYAGRPAKIALIQYIAYIIIALMAVALAGNNRAVVLASGVVCIAAIYQILYRLSTVYVLTDRRMIVRTGILATTIEQIYLADISYIMIDSMLSQDVGTLEIITIDFKFNGMREKIKLENIWHPLQIKQIIFESI